MVPDILGKAEMHGVDQGRCQQVSKETGISDGFMGLDCRTKSIEENAQAVKESKTIIWIGPMGVFQMSKFARFATGRKELVDAVVEATGTGTVTVIGGSAATACKKYGKKFEKLNTGASSWLAKQVEGT